MSSTTMRTMATTMSRADDAQLPQDIKDINVTDLATPVYPEYPSLTEYYLNLSPFITLSIFLATLLLILNISIFSTTVIKLRRRLNKPLLQLSTFLCAVYPCIALAAFLTILLPKAWLAFNTFMHLSFTVAGVVFQRLCFRYVGSELNYIKETGGEAVAIHTAPCCCCCLCLPRLIPSKGKFCLLRYMVWQMPFVQGSIMLVLNVIYYKEPDMYANVLLYFIPFIVVSILVGLWGLNITTRMAASVHSDYRLMKKMFCLQLILLLCKMQYWLLNTQLDHLVLGGPYPLNHTVYKQAIINLLIVFEMVLVSLLAQNGYKVPVELEL